MHACRKDTNSFAGPITLAADSQVNVTNLLSLSGRISGGFALTKGGNGTLQFSQASGSENTFTGALTVLNGTLKVASINNAGGNGPLGAGTAAVTLGSSGNTAVLEYTATSSGATNRAWTLAASGTGAFQVDQPATNLTLAGPIGGSGGLKKTGSGTLTLSAASNYTGVTTVSGGTLAIASTSAINSTASIAVGQGATLRVTGGGSEQLRDGAGITLNGGNLNLALIANEAAGDLVLGEGHSDITTTRPSGTGTPYLRFANGPSHTIGATANYSSTNSQIQFQANPPALVNDIIGGHAFYHNVDFAAVSTSPPYTIQQYTDYGDDPALATAATNLRPTASITISADKTINSLNLRGDYGVTITGSNTLTLNSGGLLVNATAATGCTGGALRGSQDGELVVNVVSPTYPFTISSAITNNSSATALVKTGQGRLTLSGPNTYTGKTYLNQGTLEFAQTAELSYGGEVRGVGALWKTGSGVLTLTGTSTSYSGAVTVSDGRLHIDGPFGSAASTIAVNGATLAGTQTIGGNVTVTNGTIALGSSGNIAGTVTATSGTLTVGKTDVGNCLNTSGGVNIGDSAMIEAGITTAQINGSLSYTSSADSTFSGVIAGSSRTVTVNAQAGTPTLTLSGSNAYTGGTAVLNGTLKVGDEDALGVGSVLVGENGVLDLNGLSITVPSLSGPVGGSITNSASTGTSVLTVNVESDTSTFTFLGSFVDDASHVELAKEGDGTLVIGALDYAGELTVSEGTLVADSIICGTLSIGSGASVTIAETTTGSALLAMSQSSQGSPASSATAAESVPVPEPGTVVILLAGLAVFGLGAIGRRCKRYRRGTA